VSTQTVLIVDDQPINLQLAQAVLETDGWTVLCAADGHEMQAELSCCRPDVILMDIQMPETDGLTLTRELKADPRWRSVPVIAFTALAMRGDKARLLDEGCDGYIEKSIEVEAFSA
jgi:two-component system cell cycle response regulator DivK